MKLLLSVARRREPHKWICHSCRGISSELLERGPRNAKKYGPARTRFAPSPTGYLHLGSLRTALYNYLIAKATGGQFILRIEDTDQNRTVADAEKRLYEDLRWAGIEWDEGPQIGGPYGPYKQSERLEKYQEAAQALVKSQHAYRCFCSQKRLQELASLNAKLGLPTDYDRHCYPMSTAESDERAFKKEKHVIRLKAPEQYPQVNDAVYGYVKQSFRNPKTQVAHGFDDPILLKTDGYPTYHLANVVDDHLMEITDVIRGSEWMSSTPKHLEIYKAFGWTPPNFAHVGLLVDKQRQKLSKRGGSIDVRTFREDGYFPEALNNFVALLGWSHKYGSDVMNMRDMIQLASMKYTKGNSVVAFEKLGYLQRKHTVRYAALDPAKLLDLAVRPITKSLDSRCENENFSLYNSLPAGTLREEYILSILEVDAHNYLNAKDFIQRNIYFLVPPSKGAYFESLPSFKLNDKTPFKIQPETLQLFDSILEIPDEEWNADGIRKRVFWMIGQGIIRLGMMGNGAGLSMDEVKKAWSKLVHEYLRWALNGGKNGPDMGSMMAILKREECERRLRLAERVIRQKEAQETDVAE